LYKKKLIKIFKINFCKDYLFEKKKNELTEVFSLMSRHKHRGNFMKELRIYVENSFFLQISTKRYFSEELLKTFERNELINISDQRCALFSLSQKIFTAIGNKNFFFNQTTLKKGQINTPPCLNCPNIYDCGPQNIINTFDCLYVKFWKNIKLLNKN